MAAAAVAPVLFVVFRLRSCSRMILVQDDCLKAGGLWRYFGAAPRPSDPISINHSALAWPVQKSCLFADLLCPSGIIKTSFFPISWPWIFYSLSEQSRPSLSDPACSPTSSFFSLARSVSTLLSIVHTFGILPLVSPSSFTLPKRYTSIRSSSHTAPTDRYLSVAGLNRLLASHLHSCWGLGTVLIAAPLQVPSKSGE